MTITVYTKPQCVQCNATYKALDKAGLEYEIVDITEVPEARDYVMALGYLQAPVVVADGILVRLPAGPDQGAQWRRGRHFPPAPKPHVGHPMDPVRLVYFSSVSETTHRFVQKLGLPTIRIPIRDAIEVHDPYEQAAAVGRRLPGSCPSRSSNSSTTRTTGP